MNSKKLLDDKHYYLQVFFERPDGELRDNINYKYVIFNHVGFYIPYNGIIYENVGQGLGFPQSSSDKYLPRNHVRIILPIDMRKMSEKVHNIISKHVQQYSYCVPFVVNVLKDLEIIDKDKEIDSVDDLYFSLLEYRIPTREIVNYFSERMGKREIILEVKEEEKDEE